MDGNNAHSTVVDLIHKLLRGLFDLGICICAVHYRIHFNLDLYEYKLLRFPILCWLLLPLLLCRGHQVLRLFLFFELSWVSSLYFGITVDSSVLVYFLLINLVIAWSLAVLPSILLVSDWILSLE